MEQGSKNMFSCKYGNEPADLKLLLIYFIKRIRFLIYFTIFGALIFASLYYMKTFVFVDEHEYVATGELYLVYADDVRLDNVYINDYTWQNLVKSDKAVEYAMGEIYSNVTEEELRESVTAGLVSDVRFVTLTVKTKDPELCVEIAQAYQAAIKKLGEEMVDIEAITVFTDADTAEEVKVDNRIARMAITGGVIGFILSFFWITLQYVFDDSVYVASQFERRFGVPVIGISLKTKGNETINENLVGQKKRVDKSRLWGRQAIKLNYAVLTKGCKKIVAADTSLNGKTEFAFGLLRDAKQKLEQDELLAIAMGDVKEEDAFFTSDDYVLMKVPSINEDAEAVVECAKADGVILMVQAGTHNGKLLERAMDLLVKQNCKILGALIYEGDASLLKMYYYDPLLWKNTNHQDEEADDDDFKFEDIF